MNPSRYIILLIMFLRCRCEEYCSIDNESCISEKEHNMYKKDLNERYEKYITLIHDAAESYVECNSSNCGCFNSVITRDLKPFRKKGINEKLIDIAKAKGTFYQIIGGKLYRDKECMFPSRCAGIEHYLYKVLNNLTDLELVINTRDYPQSSVHFGGPLPVFSFSKTPQYYDIMYPAWAFWEGGPAISLYPQGLGRWDKHRISLNKTSAKIPWEDKQSKAFFRGSRTSSERDNLILLSRGKPELVDAQYTKNQAWKSKEDTLNAEPAKEVPLESHCAYKYLFNYRGVAASFRHKHLFLCNSLVFHVGDEWKEFYYDAMKPWIHYIPVPKDSTKDDLDNSLYLYTDALPLQARNFKMISISKVPYRSIPETIKLSSVSIKRGWNKEMKCSYTKELILFAKHHDELAHKIAKGGRDFIWSKLRMKDVVCYWRKLLKSYAKLLTYKPQLKPHLIEVKRRT